jgi:hypothetical protein
VYRASAVCSHDIACRVTEELNQVSDLGGVGLCTGVDWGNANLAFFDDDKLPGGCARQESPGARAVARVEVLLVLVKIQSPKQKIRPDFFREPGLCECDGFRSVADEPAFHSSRFKTMLKNIVWRVKILIRSF